jgi:long-subunit fatty acid transport protein
LNFLIKDNFKNTLNLRIGGELKASRNLTLRGGYELYENPYRTYNNYERF